MNYPELCRHEASEFRKVGEKGVAALLDAAAALYEAVAEEHGSKDFEPECPECVAVKAADAAAREAGK